MSDGEVQVSVGGDLTPFQAAMAKAKVLAKSGGEAAGLEFGNRTAYMAEQRVRRGMDGVLRSLSTAKDPIDAISGAVEGLGQSFKIASGAFLAFSIGTFIKDQLEKAAASSDSFFDKFQEGMAVNVGQASASQLKGLQKNLEDLEKQYADRGILERCIFGKYQDQVIVGVRQRLAEVAKAAAESSAQLIRDQTAEITGDPLKKAYAEINVVQDEYKGKISEAKSPEEKVALAEQEQAKIDEINRKYGEDQVKRDDDVMAKHEEKRKKSADRVTAIEEEHAKQQILRNNSDETTPEKKVAALQADLAAKTLIANNTADELEREKAITAEMEAQNALTRAKADLEKSYAETQKKKFDAFVRGNEKDKEIRDRKKEESERRDDLLREQSEAASNLATAQADAMGFHGQVSSLRREGFGRTPASGSNGAQLKAAQEAVDRLDKVHKAITELNNKIGGAI